MKNQIAITLLCCLALLLIGCNSLSMQQYAEKVFVTTAEAIDTGMELYSDAVVAGLVDEETQNQVRHGHNMWRISAAYARKTYHSYTNGTGTKHSAVTALKAASAAGDEFLPQIDGIRKEPDAGTD